MSASRSSLVGLASALLLAGVGGCRTKGDAGGADASASPSAPLPSHAISPPLVPPKRDASVDPVQVAARGKELYGRYCSFCHGQDGEGYAADEAPRLANDDLLAVAPDELLHRAIVNGRPGTTMSAWSIARGGPLGFDDASAIVQHLRSWQKRPSEAEAVAARKIAEGASAARGSELYTTHCAACHGSAGTEGRYAALANPELLGIATDGYLATTIERGRAGTPMPGFAGKLSPAQIDDVVALLRSWQRPPDPIPELPPKPGAVGGVVANPRGAAPDFPKAVDFIPVDTVKRELVDKKAKMVIVDARPPADYARMHLAGAISVPFYQVAEYAKHIPKDVYVLSYCACPHAESVKVRDALRALGYPNVAVIDEGIIPWRDRGYPVRGGPKP